MEDIIAKPSNTPAKPIHLFRMLEKGGTTKLITPN